MRDLTKRARIVQMLQSNSRIADIADVCHCSYNTISRIREEEGIQPRERGPRHAEFPVDALRSILITRIAYCQSELDKATKELSDLDLLSRNHGV